MYRREIIYIGLYRNGDRVSGAGFLKAESGEEGSRMYLKTQNIPLGINGRFPVRVQDGGGWKELSSIAVQDGGGCWEERLRETVEDPVVQIRLSGGYVLEGRSRTAPRIVQDPEETEAEHAPVESAKETSRNTGRQDGPDLKAREDAGETVDETPKPAEKAPEARVVTEELPRRPLRLQNHTAAEKEGRPNFGLKEDKWEQIRDTFEQIHPYGDERVYVKLEPKDFVILQGKYQYLVNNSFLLHGFYNYRYVILGKEREEYCLGVPGVFYEREKMVAQMFGFEAFECPEGDVKAGVFGYYLRRVEL